MLLDLEDDGHRIVKVFHPDADRLWNGIYSSAPVEASDEIGYMTSDGKRHAIVPAK
jgi:hypothetical protein